MKKIQNWGPKDFELENTTVWSFPVRGNWATHDSKRRGNWSPYIPRNIILRYSDERDLILDQFAGGGTTLVEAKLLNRNIIGTDVNYESIQRCQEKIDFNLDDRKLGKVKLKNADARNLDFIDNNSIDLICTHPPYANIIKYSENNPRDLSLLNIDKFLIEMKEVAKECFRVLKDDKYCAILMGDTRKDKHMVPLAFSVMKIFEDEGFVLKELIIKEQHNTKATGFWKKRSIEYNFLLIAHEYLFIFRKHTKTRSF